jgi:hypothetical protein
VLRRRSPVEFPSDFCYPEHGPHVGDVVLLIEYREHRRALFRVRAAVRKVSSAACGSQRSKMLTRLGSTTV